MKAASPVSLLSPDCLCAVWSRTDVQSSGSRRKRARHSVQTAGRRRMVCLVLVRLEGVVSESPCLPVSLLCDTTGSGEPGSRQSLSDPSPATTPVKGGAGGRRAQTARWWAYRRQRGDNTPSHGPGSLACLALEGQSLLPISFYCASASATRPALPPRQQAEGSLSAGTRPPAKRL